MIALNHFNQLDEPAARALLAPCVAIPAWAATLTQARPYPHRVALLETARQAMAGWGEAELTQALAAHPRIGEKPAGTEAHEALSRQEQASVNGHDQALRKANARYEARFGRVFLIRAKGRSAEEILQALAERLAMNDADDAQAALAQLREITLLRLEGAIDE